MTNPFPLIAPDATIFGFACANCEAIYRTTLWDTLSAEQAAEQARKSATFCCDRRCQDCEAPLGTYRENPYICCKTCLNKRDAKREAQKYEKAAKIPEDEYCGWISWDTHGDNDGFFESTDELREYALANGMQIPEYVYACTEDTIPHLDAWDILESALERDEAYEDAIDGLDVDGLQELLNGWLEHNKLTCYHEDHERAVVLSKDRTREFVKDNGLEDDEPSENRSSSVSVQP